MATAQWRDEFHWVSDLNGGCWVKERWDLNRILLKDIAGKDNICYRFDWTVITSDYATIIATNLSTVINNSALQEEERELYGI